MGCGCVLAHKSFTVKRLALKSIFTLPLVKGEKMWGKGLLI